MMMLVAARRALACIVPPKPLLEPSRTSYPANDRTVPMPPSRQPQRLSQISRFAWQNASWGSWVPRINLGQAPSWLPSLGISVCADQACFGQFDVVATSRLRAAYDTNANCCYGAHSIVIHKPGYQCNTDQQQRQTSIGALLMHAQAHAHPVLRPSSLLLPIGAVTAHSAIPSKAYTSRPRHSTPAFTYLPTLYPYTQPDLKQPFLWDQTLPSYRLRAFVHVYFVHTVIAFTQFGLVAYLCSLLGTTRSPM